MAVIWKLLLLVLVPLTATQHISDRCEWQWFSPENRCRFMCHCHGGVQCDLRTGACPERCQMGWFGPGCQYWSHSIEETRRIGSEEYPCTREYRSFTVNLSSPLLFTWLRIIGNNADHLSEAEVELTEACDTQVARVNSHAVDISCPSRRPVTRVTVRFPRDTTVCRVEISGGRNVALRQRTEQSSAYSVWGSGNAVNGDVGTVDGSDYVLGKQCTHTREGRYNLASWELYLSEPINVVGFLIHNRRNPSKNACSGYCEERLRSFQLKAYTSDHSSEWFYYIDERRGKATHTVTPDHVIENVSKIKISKHPLEEYLTLCEVMVFGDSPCSPGRYGRMCEHRCNCADKGSCFVSTGGCPSGCALGFTGENCWKECPDGLYGYGCNETCSVHCAQSGNCDAKSGSCAGFLCEEGYQPPLCDEVCLNGTYGPNCTQTCSDHCAGPNKTCDVFDGSCELGCQLGYQPPLCDEVCLNGTYGPNCMYSCSAHCAGSNKTCDVFDGSCELGCEVGYQPPLCDQAALAAPSDEAANTGRGASEEASPGASNSPWVWIGTGIAAVVVVVAAAVVVVMVLRSRKRVSSSTPSVAFVKMK